MKRKLLSVLLATAMVATLMVGCGKTETETTTILKEAKNSTKWIFEIFQKIAKEKN